MKHGRREVDRVSVFEGDAATSESLRGALAARGIEATVIEGSLLVQRFEEKTARIVIDAHLDELEVRDDG